MSIAIIANGTLFKIDSGSGTYTTIPEVKRLSGPNIKFDLLDVTSHDSTDYFREFIPGLADGERIAASINWRPSNAVHAQIRTDQYARTKRSFKVVFPDSSLNTVTLNAYVESANPKADIGTVLEQELSVKITGEPAWT